MVAAKDALQVKAAVRSFDGLQSGCALLAPSREIID